VSAQENRTVGGSLAVAVLERWKDPSTNQQLTKKRVRIDSGKEDKGAKLLMMDGESAERMLWIGQVSQLVDKGGTGSEKTTAARDWKHGND
jgi:hypothetical protein